MKRFTSLQHHAKSRHSLPGIYSRLLVQQFPPVTSSTQSYSQLFRVSQPKRRVCKGSLQGRFGLKQSLSCRVSIAKPPRAARLSQLLHVFHLLIFPISSLSLERYCVSFTMTMMRAPPRSMQEGHSREWKTMLWSYRRVSSTASCCSLGS